MLWRFFLTSIVLALLAPLALLPKPAAAAPATQLMFFHSPGDTPAGAAFGTQPVVFAVDGSGKLDNTYAGNVTLSIKPGTGTPGAVLGGVPTVSAIAGIAIFSGLNIDTVGIGYRLTASASGLTSADSASFDVVAAAASQLTFSTSPGGATVGPSFTAQPVVQARDQFGNLATGLAGPVTLAIKSGTGTAGAPRSGTTTVNAVNGITTFAGLSIEPASAGYVLTATATGLTAADSTAIAIASPTTEPAPPEPTTPVPTTPEQKENKEDSARKPTKLVRLQSERSNQLGFDDERTEGNVVFAGRDEQGPYLIVANRDGNVRVDIVCGATCPTLPNSGYVVIEGTKLDETHYIATAVYVER